MIELRQVQVTYPSPGGARPALRGVSLTVGRGEALALMGPTGAGKSTLAQVMAGLVRPTSGEALWDGRPAADWLRRGAPRDRAARPARLPVGYLFQDPEHQLFESTVFDDVAFGPRNLGLGVEEVEGRVREALSAVGLDPATMGSRSPFGLSGGEQRRAALAGILALQPEVLILDEPTAGLDPEGADRLLDLLARLHRAGTGVVLITHRLEEAVRLAGRILILREGHVALDGPPAEVCRDPDRLVALGVEPTASLQLVERLRRRGLSLAPGLVEVESTVRAIAGLLGEPRR